MILKGAWKVDGFYKADASKVLDELSELGDEYSLSDVVEKAKDKNSEMHSIFEWDDSVAGNKYREIQAGTMVRNLVIVRNDETEEKTNIRCFVSTGKRDHTFTPTRLIVRNKSAYEELLERAYAELRAFKEKYSTLSELEEILALID